MTAVRKDAYALVQPLDQASTDDDFRRRGRAGERARGEAFRRARNRERTGGGLMPTSSLPLELSYG